MHGGALEQEHGGGYGGGLYERAPKVPTPEEEEAKKQEIEIEKKLDMLFETTEKKNQDVKKNKGDMKVTWRVKINRNDFKTYSAYLCFVYKFSAKEPDYIEYPGSALQIIYNQPVGDVPNDGKFAESVLMIEKGWLPIFRILKDTEEYWEHGFKKNIEVDALKNEYVLMVEVKSITRSKVNFSIFYNERTLIIKSTITAGKGIIFTIKSNKDKKKETYSMETPEKISPLVEHIKKHFKIGFSMYARFNAQIQRIDRLLLLDDAQSSCEEEETEHARRFTTKKSKRRASSACHR